MKNNEIKNEENNKMDENDSTVEEKEMAKRRVKNMPRKQQKAVMSNIKKKKPTYRTIKKGKKRTLTRRPAKRKRS